MNDVCVRAEIIREKLSDCLAFARWKSTQSASRSMEVRSASLAKAAGEVFPNSCHTPPARGVCNVFEAFRRERNSLCSEIVCSDEDVIAEMSRPRALFATEWSRSLFDGAAAFESSGFIDVESMPPWDYWVDVCDCGDEGSCMCLISWVPMEFAVQVDSAIAVDPSQCMSWLVCRSVRDMALHGWGAKWSDSLPLA